jgi:hypothetical protein
MTKQRTELERAAGKLISAIQKQWSAEAGEPGSAVSEEAMHNCHDLLAASKDGTLQAVLRGGSVTDFIGRAWVQKRPAVRPAILAFEAKIAEQGHAQQ